MINYVHWVPAADLPKKVTIKKPFCGIFNYKLMVNLLCFCNYSQFHAINFRTNLTAAQSDCVLLLFENIFKGCEIKNTIRDGGSTALYTAFTIYFVNTDYNIGTCLLLLLLYTA